MTAYTGVTEPLTYQAKSARGLARAFGVCKSSIDNIRNGATWGRVTAGLTLGRTHSLGEYLTDRIEYELNSGCWLWSRNQFRSGYGHVTIKEPRWGIGRGWYAAHRLAWIAFKGSIPDGLQVLHRCDVRPCINPDHLFLGTHQDNMQDMVKKRRHRRASGYKRLSPAQSREVAQAAQRIGINATARAFGISSTTVRDHVARAQEEATP